MSQKNPYKITFNHLNNNNKLARACVSSQNKGMHLFIYFNCMRQLLILQLILHDITIDIYNQTIIFYNK